MVHRALYPASFVSMGFMLLLFLLLTPSAVSTILKYRCQLLPSYKSPLFHRYRSAVDSVCITFVDPCPSLNTCSFFSDDYFRPNFQSDLHQHSKCYLRDDWLWRTLLFSNWADPISFPMAVFADLYDSFAGLAGGALRHYWAENDSYHVVSGGPVPIFLPRSAPVGQPVVFGSGVLVHWAGWVGPHWSHYSGAFVANRSFVPYFNALTFPFCSFF